MGLLFTGFAILKVAFAGVAQLVEQLICNQPVAGSSPVTSLSLETPGTKRFQGISFRLYGFFF
jgi:actin-related protein